jgi:beta-mannosidase
LTAPTPGAPGRLHEIPPLVRPASDVRVLSTGWELAAARPDEYSKPDLIDALQWIPALVPGTAAAALRAAGLWEFGDERDFDAEDWWFRTRFDAEPAQPGERIELALDGIATVAEIYLNGRLLLRSESMFIAHRLDVTAAIAGSNELVIRCLALRPLLGLPRRPRARWRTRLVSERNLRFYRAMLLGRAPGFAPGPAAVGPWKPVRLERLHGISVRELKVRARAGDSRAEVAVDGLIQTLSNELPVRNVVLGLTGPSGAYRTELTIEQTPDGSRIGGQLDVSDAQRWWPHTHGAPALYEVELLVGLGGESVSVPGGRIGFRSLETAGDLEQHGLQLRINDVSLFARGAVWTPLDLAVPCSKEDGMRLVLASVVQAGMNMLRVPGIACYESDAFYDLCDELGILVWQDFMFANQDYPDSDAEFMGSVRQEAQQLLQGLGQRPCLAVLCGGSEVAQQAAMLGRSFDLSTSELYGNALPAAVEQAEVDAPYIPSTPWGGDLPFRPDRGVANYYGVGAYLRPLEDARRVGLRFAAECLAFSNVPDEDALSALVLTGDPVVHHPRWKAGVPRDVGAGWDFEDVRDHYLRLLYEVDPVALRSTDHDRYLELSRHVTGEVMAEAFGEWRREASPCAGALVLWLTDLMPGAGWGLLDHRGLPKTAFHYVRRALAPVAVWSVDEGLGGVVVHVANDRSTRLAATLRIAMYRDSEIRVEEVEHEVDLDPRELRSFNVEALLGRFVDASWSYRFGPPAQNVIVCALEKRQPAHLLAQAFRFPAGRPTRQETAEQLGLTGRLEITEEGKVRMIVSTKRLAYGVRAYIPGFMPDDDGFSIEPGRARAVQLQPTGAGEPAVTGHLTALNLVGRVPVASEKSG